MSSGTSSSARHVRKPVPVAEVQIDPGSVSNSVYHNPSFGVTCKIPPGWVLRTEDMNPPEEGDAKIGARFPARVLLAAFSRPPEARGQDVNGSILIAAESAAEYPGLKDAAQYLGPVSEIAKARGFEIDGEPYQSSIGAKTVAREDFHKDVGTRVMRQSTLVILARGYVLSFTFIWGAEDEVEELVEGLSFAATTKPQSH